MHPIIPICLSINFFITHASMLPIFTIPQWWPPYYTYCHPYVNEEALTTMLSTDPTIASSVTKKANTLTAYKNALVARVGLYSLIHMASGK